MENDIYCNVGRSSCTILPNGDIIPCDRLRIKIGNIKKQKIEKIWSGSTVLKKIRALSLDSLDECKDCKYKFICRGGCRGRAYSQRGSLYAADFFACKLLNSGIPKIS
ncbi:MAG: SPASM domain-containing protein [Thermoproteota archaeon]